MSTLKLTLLLYVGRKPLGFGVSFAMDLVFECRPEIPRLKFIDEIHLVFIVGMEVDLFFLCLGRKCYASSVGIG